MDREKIIRDGLLLSLAERYEADRSQFVTLARHTMDSSFAREVVAELRNEGHILEEMRGVIRLTPRGYQSYKSRRFSDTRGN